MYQIPIILLIFYFRCGGEYNTSEFVWEQKTESTKIVLDKVPNKEWMGKQAELDMRSKKSHHSKDSKRSASSRSEKSKDRK